MASSNINFDGSATMEEEDAAALNIDAFKSPNDKRTYRLIELENGMKVRQPRAYI